MPPGCCASFPSKGVQGNHFWAMFGIQTLGFPPSKHLPSPQPPTPADPPVPAQKKSTSCWKISVNNWATGVVKCWGPDWNTSRVLRCERSPSQMGPQSSGSPQIGDQMITEPDHSTSHGRSQQTLTHD